MLLEERLGRARDRLAGLGRALDDVQSQSGLRRAWEDACRGETGIEPFDAWARELAPFAARRPPAAPGELELVFRPDAKVYDGRYAASDWLVDEFPRLATDGAGHWVAAWWGGSIASGGEDPAGRGDGAAG